MAASSISEEVRNWATQVAVVLAALTYCGNVCVESDRWHAHLSVRLAVRANAFLATLTPDGAIPPARHGTETLNLMVRNQSFRPAAIVEKTLLDSEGNAMRDPDSSCDGVRLPLAVKPWQIVPCRAVMSTTEFGRLNRIVVKGHG
ncbi:MAG TPA: hypothetical protein VLV17_05695 [Anaeromyxobacteraceae bacterium]|nr:hypothetical protein [Anaeromyxobacteraceae bacterium]